MLRDILWPKIPIGVVNRWSNSHASQFGAVQEIFHQFTGLLRTSRDQSSYVIKSSQSILISHLLLITIPCKRNSGLRVIGYFTSPREKRREEIGERQSRDRKRDGRLLGTTSPAKKQLCVKIPQFRRESAIVLRSKSDHFQATVPAMEFTRLYITAHDRSTTAIS